MLRKIFIALSASLALLSVNASAVEINKADQSELETVKGIGPVMAQKILDARSKAVFKDWADLQSRVKGMGERKMAKLSAEGLTVNGAAKSGQAQTATTASPKK